MKPRVLYRNKHTKFLPLQEAHKGANPVLIRIATKSGHGASNTKKAIEETADVYAFLMWMLGMKPTGL